ncbi:MAG: sensor histidine kinase [Flavobacteriaceae bacterium]|nr:sensor histidine kinase [Flavobacteriaceae bacterium]
MKKKNDIIYKALNEKEILMKETHHRVKNSFQIVSSLLYLQSQNIENKKAARAVAEAQERVKSMILLHQKLYQNDNLMGISSKGYIENLVSDIFESYKLTEDVKVAYDIEEIMLNIDTMTPIGLIVNELVTNVIKHAFENDQAKKEVFISFFRRNKNIQLSVKDNGVGLKEEDKNTFGMKLIHSLAKKLKADISFVSGKGTEAIVLIKKFKEV